MSDSSAVTVLGLGQMGQALTGALLGAGLAVTVWNRTEAKAADLRAGGAQWAPTPAEAIAASDITLINVVDHAALDALVTAAGSAVAGRTIVSLSSDTPDAARRTAALVEAAAGQYLDGAIMTPTTTIGTPDASILCAGPRKVFDEWMAVLTALATPTWLAEDYGRAAAFDVALLNLFWTSVSGSLNALKVAEANGIGATELLPHALGIVDILPSVLTEVAERIRDDQHDEADSPVVSVAASLRHVIAASDEAGVDPSALAALQRTADAVVADGRGQDEISRLFGYV
jgi:3-hydroxyisobutyrate dehydrogenase-like beta-hydroxyacid dehydrogenase